MKKQQLLTLGLLIVLGTVTQVEAQTSQQRQIIAKSYDLTKLEMLKKEFRNKFSEQKRLALEQASINGWSVMRKNVDGSIDELMSVAEDGSPIYYTLYNLNAAKSTRANHLNIGGPLGLSLDGQNMTAHVWDGGAVRPTHQEFDGPGGNNRAVINDGISVLNGNSFHAQHVTGTIMAYGKVPNAKGMAPRAGVLTHDWNNDLSEAASAAASGMLISNHSYGYNANSLPDWYFGAYISESRNWDNLMYNSPYYLMVVAAGNDGNNNSANAEPLGNNSSFDKLNGHATCKNNMVVANGQDANVASDGTLISVAINSSSSEGPTDDFRIKPDITGNGTGVYSTYDNSDNAYNSITGTSMASPNVAGTLLLLQQHANNVNGSFMRAATLKGLALHTADDAGIAGPDAIYGWGLLNAKAAAEAISQNGSFSKIEELTLNNGQDYSFTVDASGTDPLMVSISWTDPAGATNNGTANLSTPALVNDLDVRVVKGAATYTPYRLTGVNSNGKGDNNVDPYERIDVSGATGTYTVTVSHKGTLRNGSQKYALIVTGMTNSAAVCHISTPADLKLSSSTSNSAIINWSVVAGANYDVRYRATGSANWSLLSVSGTNATLAGLDPETEYEVQVRSKCDDGQISSFSSSLLFTTPAFTVTYCPSNAKSVNDEYIGRVQVGTIDQSSAGTIGGYADYTSISTTLARGTGYDISIQPVWSGTVYKEGYSVWIDFNQNGDFSDAGEQVFFQEATTSTSITGSITIPQDVLEGNTRMRISMKYNAISSPCESFNYGEVEDYTIKIGAGDNQPPTVPDGLAASLVEQTSLTLSWRPSTDNVGVVAYDVYEGTTLLGTVSGPGASVSGLTPATSYTFRVKARDAAGNESDFSEVLEVSTLGEEMSCSVTAGIPHTESFEGNLGAWTNVTGDDFTWAYNYGPTASSNTGPSSASHGNYYAYMESSSPNYPNKVAILESPCFDLETESSASFSFKYHMYGASAMGNLSLEVTTDEQEWVALWSKSGNQGNKWNLANVNLGEYLGKSVKLRFVGVTGTTWQGDMAIDDTRLSRASIVNAQLTLHFDKYPRETSWQILDGSTLIASGDNYGSQPINSILVEEFTLAEGCYNLVISDTYGDGMCCYYGDGSYTLTAGGSTLASGGAFGATETTNFCVGPVANSNFSVASYTTGNPVRYDIYPNPVMKGMLHVNSTHRDASYRIVDLSGQVLLQGQLSNDIIDIRTLAIGTYLIQFEADGKSLTRKFVKKL